MKKIVSVSLGSSKRDHQVEIRLLGQQISIQRIGTDGSMEKAIQLIKELDGKVDAFGMGGIDLYLYAGTKRYTIRDAEKIARAAKITPVVDGSGLKNTLERGVIKYLARNKIIDFSRAKVLMVSAVDRFGMAQALVEEKSQVVFGDLIFGLGIPVPIRSIQVLERVARIAIPVISRMPFKFLYPTGDKQEEQVAKFSIYYHEADVIAGDFHFIKRYLPPKLEGKIIITNTVTEEDVALLAQVGIKTLVTTTPELAGRSFGTNVMEGVLISLMNKPASSLVARDYEKMLEQLRFEPRILELQNLTTA